jgi:LacI family transcriptional regulator
MTSKYPNTRPRVIGFHAAIFQQSAGRALEGVLDYVDEHEQLVLRDFRHLDFAEGLEYAPPPMWTGKVAGMLNMTAFTGSVDAMVRWLQRGGVPVVSMTDQWLDRRIPTVAIDSMSITRAAVEYFVDRGYQHYLIISDVLAVEASDRRHALFRRLLAPHRFEPLRYDFQFRPEGSIEDFELAQRETGIGRLLEQADKPLAVFAINDNHARAVCVVCEQLGLDVPGDVAVLGSGNLNASRCHTPTISTIHLPYYEVGYEAAKRLHRILSGGRVPRKPVLFTAQNVIERQSTCARHRHHDEIEHALEYIRQHACEGISVEDIVRVLAISRRTFESRFIQRVGHSPGHEIQNVQIQRAKHLLADTELSITRIGAMVGFAESASFTRFIKRHTGVSPREYRRRYSR